MIRVAIKASSPLAKAGLETLLHAQPGLGLVEDSGIDSPPDVLLVECETFAAPAAREAIEWASAGGPVVMLVRNPATEPVGEALRAGVRAVLASGADGPEIAAAIEGAAVGLTVLDGAYIETLLRAPVTASSGPADTLAEPLTPREVEVLGLVAAGLGNKEIAARLEISEHTAKFHVASIMGKLGAGSRTEAVTIGIRHGLIMI
jgi:DNA-binding NarL/FixJ family response regulator